MFYKSKVDFYILDAGKRTQEDPGQFADAYGRAYGMVRKEKNALISRLKKKGCSPVETAAVLALWLSRTAKEDRMGYPTKKALQDVHRKLFISPDPFYQSKDDPRGTKKMMTITHVMREEGIEPERADYA